MKQGSKAFYSVLLALGWILTMVGTALANAITGPNSSQSPYILRSQPGAVTRAIFTVGDSANYKVDGVTPYRMVGIPDGLGAFDNGDGTFTLLMNYELGSTVGIERAHGAKGAFVSKWVVRTEDLAVLSVEDLISDVQVWNNATQQYEPATLAQKTFNRFCSANLPAPSAFYDASSGLGYDGRIFMNGKESGAEGRAFAHLMNGTSYECPGSASFVGELARQSCHRRDNGCGRHR